MEETEKLKGPKVAIKSLENRYLNWMLRSVWYKHLRLRGHQIVLHLQFTLCWKAAK